jgi:DNA-binding transcriptional regulator LsrR (DeoR family)
MYNDEHTVCLGRHLNKNLPWQDFQSIENVIAVVGGLEKKNANLGALRTGLFKRLIIDDQTALAVLEESED